MANDLTVPLAVVGGGLVAALAAYGWWQTRKARPKSFADEFRGRDTEPGAQDDAASIGARREAVEPSFDGAPAAASMSSGERHAAAVAAVAADAVAGGFQAASVPREAPQIDPLIDAVATLAVASPVSGDAALAHMPPTRRAGSKPFRIEGLSAETGQYECLRAGQRYSELQAGVQMANRVGAINEIEYSEFVQKVQDFCDAIGAIPEFPEMLDVVARARELDAFAGEHDAQLAVHLRARSQSWTVPYIQQHAARHGFVAGAVPGRLVLPSREALAPPILVLAFDPQAALDDGGARAAVRDVTLSFDVPQSASQAEGEEPFLAWQATAKALSLGMDAEVVDDRGQPIAAEGFRQIEVELAQLYQALAARDLAAGSAAARRLFT